MMVGSITIREDGIRAGSGDFESVPDAVSSPRPRDQALTRHQEPRHRGRVIRSDTSGIPTSRHPDIQAEVRKIKALRQELSVVTD